MGIPDSRGSNLFVLLSIERIYDRKIPERFLTSYASLVEHCVCEYLIVTSKNVN